MYLYAFKDLSVMSAGNLCAENCKTVSLFSNQTKFGPATIYFRRTILAHRSFLNGLVGPSPEKKNVKDPKVERNKRVLLSWLLFRQRGFWMYSLAGDASKLIWTCKRITQLEILQVKRPTEKRVLKYYPKHRVLHAMTLFDISPFKVSVASSSQKQLDVASPNRKINLQQWNGIMSPWTIKIVKPGWCDIHRQSFPVGNCHLQDRNFFSGTIPVRIGEEGKEKNAALEHKKLGSIKGLEKRTPVCPLRTHPHKVWKKRFAGQDFLAV